MWLAEIRAKIEEGYAAAERGELIDGDEVRARLEQHKREWLAKDKMCAAGALSHSLVPIHKHQAAPVVTGCVSPVSWLDLGAGREYTYSVGGVSVAAGSLPSATRTHRLFFG